MKTLASSTPVLLNEQFGCSRDAIDRFDDWPDFRTDILAWPVSRRPAFGAPSAGITACC
jgi:hypothetical protein